MDCSFLTLKWPWTMLLTGPSGSGKTTLTSEIVKNIETYSNFKPSKIYVVYKEMQPLYHSLAAPCPVQFVRGLTGDFKHEPNSLIIIDDLQISADKSVIGELFTVKSHHANCSIIYLVQNLFDKDPRHRVISLNSSYIIIFRNPRDRSQIEHLGKQMLNAQLIKFAYKRATGEPHTYLVVDLKQSTPDWARLRGSIGPVSHLVKAVIYCNFNDLPAEATLLDLHYDQ